MVHQSQSMHLFRIELLILSLSTQFQDLVGPNPIFLYLIRFCVVYFLNMYFFVLLPIFACILKSRLWPPWSISCHISSLINYVALSHQRVYKSHLYGNVSIKDFVSFRDVNPNNASSMFRVVLWTVFPLGKSLPAPGINPGTCQADKCLNRTPCLCSSQLYVHRMEIGDKPGR